MSGVTWHRVSEHRCPVGERSDLHNLHRFAEHLLWEQDRAKRRARVMESFQLTHRKFMDGESRPEVTQGLLSDAWDGRLAHHQIHFRQAWKDGVQAARRLLSGHLPRELYSVLGVA
jgi:hypothetical protein